MRQSAFGRGWAGSRAREREGWEGCAGGMVAGARVGWIRGVGGGARWGVLAGRGRWGGARQSGAVEGWSLDGGRAVGTQLSQARARAKGRREAAKAAGSSKGGGGGAETGARKLTVSIVEGQKRRSSSGNKGGSRYLAGRWSLVVCGDGGWQCMASGMGQEPIPAPSTQPRTRRLARFTTQRQRCGGAARALRRARCSREDGAHTWRRRGGPGLPVKSSALCLAVSRMSGRPLRLRKVEKAVLAARSRQTSDLQRGGWLCGARGRGRGRGEESTMGC